MGAIIFFLPIIREEIRVYSSGRGCLCENKIVKKIMLKQILNTCENIPLYGMNWASNYASWTSMTTKLTEHASVTCDPIIMVQDRVLVGGASSPQQVMSSSL